MRAERGDPSVWKEVERGVAEFDIEPSMPRTTGRQQPRMNDVPVTNPETYCQRAE